MNFFLREVGQGGPSETFHDPELDPETMEAINSLGMAVKDALESRGTERNEEKRSESSKY